MSIGIIQVTNIEYVGPHQIQTTTSPSVNFSARIDSSAIISDFTREEPDPLAVDKKKTE